MIADEIPFRTPRLSRRALLRSAAMGGGMIAFPGWAQAVADLGLPGKLPTRPMTAAFPGKGPMILQRVRPPLLETPIEVFDKDVITPNDRFYVRWHWGSIPESVEVDSFRLSIGGHVERPIAFTLDQLIREFDPIEYVAVNQCSGNSRGLFQPNVSGAEWAHGAMGNARWRGVRLRDLLDRAGVKAGAIDVRFGGLDEAMTPEAPKFLKSLALDHARDGEVMVAYQMNGEQLPLLNGFPLRLVVPGWYSTYWIKMLNQVEVLDRKDDNFWMAKAYRVPSTPFGHIAPGTKDYPSEPISRMVPRSLVTNLREGQRVKPGTLTVAGIAMGGDCGVARVEVSTDGGTSWQAATLGKDEGPYSFRRFEARITAPTSGALTVSTRCTNMKGLAQPLEMNWNPGGYMRAGVETVHLIAGDA